MHSGAVNLLDPDSFVSGVPHEYFAWLRANEPVSWNEGRPGRGFIAGVEEPEQRGFWVVTRHADVQAVSRDPVLFSSERGSAVNADMQAPQLALFQQLFDLDVVDAALQYFFGIG